MLYIYEGGWWNNKTYSFNTGENGDVLFLPYGISRGFRRDNTLYLESNGGNLALQLNGSSYMKFTFDGSSISRWKIADQASNFIWYENNVDLYLFYNDFGSIYSFGDADIRLDDFGKRAKNLAVFGGNNVLFGNNMDNYIQDSQGNSHIWGGLGSDTIKSGGGSDIFYFGRDNGHDAILDVSDDDLIFFYNVNSRDFDFNDDKGLRLESWNKAILTLHDGSTLEIYSESGFTNSPVFQFADGLRCRYSNGTWYDADYGWSWDLAEDSVGSDISTNSFCGDANVYYGTVDADNIFVGKGDGNDLIFNTAQDDTIHLCDVTLSDIVATAVNDNSIAIQFNTFETTAVETAGNLSPKFKLASGDSYVYNREMSSWQQV